MAKLKRRALRHYIRFGEGAWFLIGKSISDMSVSMNGSFEQVTDITGETTTQDDGYKPQMSVEPYFADPTDTAIYPTLKDLAMNRKSGDDAKAQYLEVWIDDDEATEHSAWQEDCRIEITQYGGDTSGLQISFNVWADGNRKEGTATYSGKVPTFTEKSGALG